MASSHTSWLLCYFAPNVTGAWMSLVAMPKDAAEHSMAQFHMIVITQKA